MKLDVGTLYVGAILISLCIMPFVFIYMSKNKKQQAFKNSLTKMATDTHTSLGKHEFFVDFALGTDLHYNYLYVVKEKDRSLVENTVFLNEYSSSKVVQTDHIIRKNKSRDVVIEKLELNLTDNHTHKETLIEFYNNRDGLPLDGQLQSIKTWNDLINASRV
ncbi:hypothetical protein [Cytophaga sp. FL35]|uniref:hypothetical protein n=1 Tax=Cytophaga sp. FL35 TaxID=1904456 RepID=UPI001653A580|nr:hypothetical protein [Cytophaga sp. FL35]MBC6999243.1 hypothetical protein [Cytophaga sp. FL35]